MFIMFLPGTIYNHILFLITIYYLDLLIYVSLSCYFSDVKIVTWLTFDGELADYFIMRRLILQLLDNFMASKF